jgi:hypothetical protein
MSDDQIARDAVRYQLLRDYLLMHGFVIHQKIPEYQEPFVMDTDFYGHTFEDAVDALPVHLPQGDASTRSKALLPGGRLKN